MFNFYNLSKFVKKFAPIILVVVIFSGLFLASVGDAHAFPTAEEIATSIVLFFLKAILNIVQFFTGLIGQLFSSIVDSITLAGFSKMEVVNTGWTITRDLVNMFFILGIVIIAFATILKIETYNIKALLPKLIIMALLINFSFVISGMIVDASNVTFKFFRNGIENDNIGKALISIAGADKAMFGTDTETHDKEGNRIITTKTLSSTEKVTSLAFSIVMIGLTGFVLLKGAVLLFTRVIALWVLIIFAPIAWFFSIFPALATHSKKWWTQLLGWSFFAPIYMFFIYLSFLLAKELQAPKFTGHFKEANTALIPSSFTSLLSSLFGYIVIIIILYLATTIAKTLGLAGADAAVKFAGTVAKGGVGKVFGIAGKTASYAGRATRITPLLQKSAGKTAEKWGNQKWRRRLLPGRKAAIRALSRFSQKGQARIAEYGDKIPDLPKKGLLAGYHAATNPYEKMAYLQKLNTKAGDDDGVNRLIKKKLNTYERLGGNKQALINDNLSLAEKGSEEMKKAIAYRRKEGKALLKKEEVQGSKSPEIVEAVRVELGNKDFVEAIKKLPKTLRETIGDSLITNAKKSEKPFDEDNLEQRNAYAKLTNKASEAFEDKDGKVNHQHLGDFAKGLKAKAIAEMDTASIKDVAKHIDVGTARAARIEMSSGKANQYGEHFSDAVKNELRRDASWASNISPRVDSGVNPNH